jgi:lysophospholipase L1-like esterase
MSASILFAAIVSQLPAADPPLPKVLLVGDSIRQGYAPIVIEKLKDKVTFINPKENCEDSANVIKNLDTWMEEMPGLVVVNCGLHDIKTKNGKYQVDPEKYEKNLKEIVTRIRGKGAKIVFANTTPIDDERHKNRKTGFDRKDADVKKYNEIAAKVMKAENVPMIDLYTVVTKAGAKKVLRDDGTHYGTEGNLLLATAVVEAIQQRLAAIK